MAAGRLVAGILLALRAIQCNGLDRGVERTHGNRHIGREGSDALFAGPEHCEGGLSGKVAVANSSASEGLRPISDNATSATACAADHAAIVCQTVLRTPDIAFDRPLTPTAESQQR